MRVRRAFQQFRRNQLGTLAVSLALGLTTLITAIGAAVDFARFTTARTAMQAAVDSAVLTGTRVLITNSTNSSGALAAAQASFDKNLASVGDIQSSGISFAVNAGKDGMTGGGVASVQMSFMGIFGVHRLRFNVQSAAQAGIPSPASNLEISLMLDVTGSMCDDGQGPCTTSAKMNGLKSAAKHLIDTVVWADQSKYYSKVALVPFSTRVRVEPDGQAGSLMGALTNMAPSWSGWYKMCTQSSGSGSSETSGNWTCQNYQTQHYAGWKLMPCVTDRYYDATSTFDFTDNPPGSGAWFNGHDGSRMPISWDSSDSAATTDRGNTSSDPATFWNYESGGTCYDVSNSDQIVPLSSDRASLDSHIDGLEAYGATAGILGTAFSWYTLSPNWANIWTGTAKPGSYAQLTQINSSGAPTLRKIAILMTDGAYNTWRGWKDQDPQTVSNYALSMCNAMKAKGIEIYTVGFDLGSIPQNEKNIATNMLKACGSDIDHFYQSLDVQQLNAAFQSIADRVANAGVRLMK